MTAHRGPGRPRLVEGQDTEPLMVRVPKPLYDEICRVAYRKGIPVSALLRCVLSQRFVTTNPLIETSAPQ
jgi:hypothetical protein